MEGGPSLSTTMSSRRSGDSGRERSRSTVSARTPASRSSSSRVSGSLSPSFHLVKKMSAPFSASARQIAVPILRRRPAPVTTAPRPRRRPATLAQDPGVLHDAAAGDIDQAAAGCCDAGHGPRYHLDSLRVRRESMHAVVGVGVPQGQLATSFAGGAEYVGREVYGALGYVLDGVLLNRLSELLDGLFGFFRSDEDILAAPSAAALYYQLVEVLHDVASVFLDGQRPGFGVLNHRFFIEIGSDHLRYERVDALIVDDVDVRGEDGVYPALEVSLDELREVVVDPSLLYALVDDVYPSLRLTVY